MMLASLKPFCLYSFNVCCASAAVAKLDTIMKYFGFAVVASALFCAGTEAEDAVAVAGVVLRATVFFRFRGFFTCFLFEVSVFGEPTFFLLLRLQVLNFCVLLAAVYYPMSFFGLNSLLLLRYNQSGGQRL